jgi:uncharacterized protein YjiS (DUF1127 family)
MNSAAFSPRLTTQATTGVPALIANVVERFIVWARRRRQVRRNIRRLTVLDDRLLADIGVARDQIRQVARLGRLPDWD